MNALKRIFAYLKDSSRCGLFYYKNKEFSLKAFTELILVGLKLIEKVLVAPVNFLDIHWFLGLARSKIVSHYSLLRRNTLQLGVVVHKYCG